MHFGWYDTFFKDFGSAELDYLCTNVSWVVDGW